MSEEIEKAIGIAEKWRDYAPYTVGYNEVDIFLAILLEARAGYENYQRMLAERHGNVKDLEEQVAILEREKQFETDEVERIGKLEAAQRHRADAAERKWLSENQ